MSTYIRNYVASCPTCCRTKTYPARPAGPLRPNPIPERCWQHVTINLIAPLPESRGHDAILVVVDRLSKRVHLIPTSSDVESAGIARLFLDRVWKLHGLPEVVIYDRGSVFVSQFLTSLYHLLGICGRPSTAYHPQTNGQTERVNQEDEQYLRAFVNHDQNDWADWIPICEFAYNNRIHSATQTTPFLLDTGQDPRLGMEPRRTASNVAATEVAAQWRRAEDNA